MPAPSYLTAERMQDARSCILRDSHRSNTVFAHTAMTQTSLPHSDPGVQTAQWDVRQGEVRQILQAGFGFAANGEDIEQRGLPYGTRARLLLVWIMTEAVRTGLPTVNLLTGVSSFVRTLGLQVHGPETGRIREQLRRIAATHYTLISGRTTTRGPLVAVETSFHATDEYGNPSVWPGKIELGERFMLDLLEHAVPMRLEAVKALRHSSLAFDMYMWLVYRLCRVAEGSVVKISWESLYRQFGQDRGEELTQRQANKRLHAFRQRVVGRSDRPGALPAALLVYPQADDAVKATGDGLELRFAPPAVPIMLNREARQVAAAGISPEPYTYDPQRKCAR